MGDNPLLQLDPGIAVWTLVVFAILLVVLKKVAWGPLLSAIDARDERLRATMEEAEKTRLANERAEGERDRMMKEAVQRADAIVADARVRAEELAKRMDRDARGERDGMLAAARKSVEAMKSSAARELRSRTVDAAVELTAKLLRSKLDEEADRRVAERMMDELERGA